MSKLDDILLQFGNYQSPKDKQIVKWKADIKDLMLEIIGEDYVVGMSSDALSPTDYEADDLSKNELKAELRQKVEEL